MSRLQTLPLIASFHFPSARQYDKYRIELNTNGIKPYFLGLHRISYPAPATAEIRPNFHIRPYPAPAGYGRRNEAGYEVGFDHLSMPLPHCVIGQQFIVIQFCHY